MWKQFEGRRSLMTRIPLQAHVSTPFSLIENTQNYEHNTLQAFYLKTGKWIATLAGPLEAQDT